LFIIKTKRVTSVLIADILEHYCTNLKSSVGNFAEASNSQLSLKA